MMTTTQKTISTLTDLNEAEQGSYYTILGAGGDLNEWVEGYEKLLKEQEIGQPVAWYSTTGEAVNEYANPARWQDAFQSDLTILLFPLDGLNVGRLAMFKLQMQDRWFDDVVQNMRARVDDEEGE